MNIPRIAPLIAVIALAHPAAKAADNHLWREQVSVPPFTLQILELAATRVVASDDWLWREQRRASGTAPLYVVRRVTADAGPPAHALWREQVARRTGHSTPSVARSSESGDE